MDAKTQVKELRDRVAQFVGERDWEQFHTLKNLAMSVAIEAAELMELFQWDKSDEVPGGEKMTSLRHELADVVIYALAMANVAGIDLSDAIMEKMSLNARKYPVESCRGRAKAGCRHGVE